MSDLSQLLDTWLRRLPAQLPAAHELRRAIHANPRVSGDEQATTDAVARAMRVEFDQVANTGAITRLGPTTGPSVALRGELDALPVREETGVGWASTSGAMHACGHDVHLAALTAVVRAAADLDLPYGLVPFLQPREETYPSGAQDIKNSGRFADLQVTHAIGAHVHPGVPLGAVAAGDGFVNAAAGEITIEVTGAGGHGAYPHQATDVAVCVAQIVTGLAEVVRRSNDPMEPALISVGTIQVGNGAANVLPHSGRVFATIRTTSTAATERVVTAVDRFARGTGEAFGCRGEVTHVPGEPALINDAALSARFADTARRAGLGSAPIMRSLGADDFSFYGDIVPTLMCFVGVDTGAKNAPSLHDAKFLPPEEAVEMTARALIAGYVAAAEEIRGD